MSCELVPAASPAEIELEDLQDVVDAYHRRVADLSLQFGGFVFKRIGNLALVSFGHPAAHEDDAERAVSAGLELCAAAGSMRSQTPCQIRVGIATGQVIVSGVMGSGDALEQGLVGEVLNLSGRLQAAAKPAAVVVDRTTRRLIGDWFHCRELGLIGATQGDADVQAWEVLQRRTVESRFAALRSGTLTPLVGREEEIELLQRRWRQAREGEERVVLISGEPGIGKSRVIAALEERIQREPYGRLSFSCSPHHNDSAFHPFIAQLERSAQFSRQDAPEEKFAKLEMLLSRTAPDPEDIALLANLLLLPATDRYPRPNLSIQRTKERTSDVLVGQVVKLAQQHPALIIFEDVHWIDPTSSDVLSLMIERLPSCAALVLITFRPEFQPPWVGQPNVTTVSLSRLARRDSAALAQRVGGDRVLPARTLDEIAERSDGVPLFIEEITKAVLEATEVPIANDVSLPLPSASAVPATLQASLMSRLDRLGPAKQVAQIGAAIGREFSHELLSLVAMQDEEELQSSLDRLVQSGLVFRRVAAPGATFLFKHALIQDTAYGTLLRGARQELHARIAHAMETHFKEIVEQHPETLGHHYEKADQVEKAVQYWIRAGDLASKRSTGREAAAHYRAALRIIDTQSVCAPLRELEPQICMKLGNVLMQSEGYRSIASIESYRRAQTRATELSQPVNFAKAGIALGPLFFGQCRYRDFLATAEDISRRSMELPPQTRVHLLVMMGVANYCVGNFAACWEQCDAARAIDREAPGTHENPIGGGDPAIVVRCYQRFAGAVLGKIAEALALSREGLAIARARKDAFTLAWALLDRARALRPVGSLAEAVECANEAAEIWEQRGFRARLGAVLMARGALRFDRGDVERGIAEMIRGCDIWRETSGNFHMSGHLSDLVDCLLRANRSDEAEAVLREAEGIASETEERSHLAELWRLRGMVLLLFRDGDYFRRAIDWSRERQAGVFELRARRDLARLYFANGSRDMAIDILNPALGAFPGEPIFTDLRESQALMTAMASTSALAPPDGQAESKSRDSKAHSLRASNIPIRVPAHFKGRDDALAAIEIIFKRCDDGVAITALHGLRGIGKTTLAAAYAERHCDEYRATWWIRAQAEPSMRVDLVAFGVRLGWVSADDKEGPALVAVLDRLRHEGEGILLVYDNAIDADQIKPYVPHGGRARILVTSNAHAWRTIAKPLEIGLWPKEVGADSPHRPRGGTRCGRGIV
jgi:class 3 adenylate cyclase/tetratricopeptide (TPR) repeat protein